MNKLFFVFPFILFAACTPLFNCKNLEWSQPGSRYGGRIIVKHDSILYGYEEKKQGLILDSSGHIIGKTKPSEILFDMEQMVFFIDSLRNIFFYKKNKEKVIYILPINEKFDYGSEKFEKYDEIQLIIKEDYGWFKRPKTYLKFIKINRTGKKKEKKYLVKLADIVQIYDIVPYKENMILLEYQKYESDTYYIGLIDTDKLEKWHPRYQLYPQVIDLYRWFNKDDALCKCDRKKENRVTKLKKRAASIKMIDSVQYNNVKYTIRELIVLPYLEKEYQGYYIGEMDSAINTIYSTKNRGIYDFGYQLGDYRHSEKFIIYYYNNQLIYTTNIKSFKLNQYLFRKFCRHSWLMLNFVKRSIVWLKIRHYMMTNKEVPEMTF